MSNPEQFNNFISWHNVPYGLIALLLFSGSTTLFAAFYYTTSDELLRDTVVPHTGWIGLFLYIIFFLFSILLIITRKAKLRRDIVIGFILLLCYGLFNYYTHLDGENYGNPYLTYGTYRPIWDILLPLLWVIILSNKQVKEYCNVGI